MPRPALLVLLIISGLFVAAGVAMVFDGAENGWPVLLFFGVCLGTAVSQLWPRLARIGSRRTEPAEILLQRFPGPIELHASKTKMLALMVGSAVFGGCMLWMALRMSPAWPVSIFVWAGAVMFLAGAPVIGVIALLGSSLRLGEDGFWMIAGGRASEMLWRNVGPFEVSNVMGNRMVIFDDEAARDRKVARANIALVGKTSGLSDSYGLAHDELAWLMNQWRDRTQAG